MLKLCLWKWNERKLSSYDNSCDMSEQATTIIILSNSFLLLFQGIAQWMSVVFVWFKLSRDNEHDDEWRQQHPSTTTTKKSRKMKYNRLCVFQLLMSHEVHTMSHNNNLQWGRKFLLKNQLKFNFFHSFQTI